MCTELKIKEILKNSGIQEKINLKFKNEIALYIIIG